MVGASPYPIERMLQAGDWCSGHDLSRRDSRIAVSLAASCGITCLKSSLFCAQSLVADARLLLAARDVVLLHAAAAHLLCDGCHA